MSPYKISIIVCRILMGLPLFIFGLNAFIGFMPMPNEIPPEEGGFSPAAFKVLNDLWDTGFMMQSVCIAHVLTGASLLVNRFLPLALAIHLPVSIQMTLFHLVLEPISGVMAYAILAINLFLMYAHRTAYLPMLVAKHELA